MRGDVVKLHQHQSRALLILALGMSASACTTLRSWRSVDEKAPAGAVVTQVSRQEPLLSGHDRQYWLDLRQAKQLMPKLQGALATGESEAGVQLARAYLVKRPGDPQGLTMLASALAMTKNYELADYYAMLAERAQTGNAAALNLRGLALMLGSNRKVADYQRAQEFFRQSFESDPTQIAAGLNAGALALEFGNPEAAAATFQSVVQRCDHCISGLMGLGLAKARTGKAADAVSAFQEVLNKKSNHPQALYNLALVYKNGYNDSKQAEKYLFALLNDSKTKNVALRERAHTVLRMIKGEASREERTMMVEDEVPQSGGEAVKEASLGDERDAELLMTGSEMSDP